MENYIQKKLIIQIITNIISQLEFPPIILTKANPANRSNERNFGELPPSQ